MGRPGRAVLEASPRLQFLEGRLGRSSPMSLPNPDIELGVTSAGVRLVSQSRGHREREGRGGRGVILVILSKILLSCPC